MRKAGRVVAQCLEEIKTQIKPGMTTLDLDLIAREIMEKEGAKPSFLGYHGYNRCDSWFASISTV